MVEYSDDAIVGTNPDGIIATWNKGAEQLLGYAADETVGKPFTVLVPTERRREEARILKRIKGGHAVKHYETVLRRKNGSQVAVSLTVSPVRDAEGRVTGTSHIARDITRRQQEDITARKRTEAALRESEERLRLAHQAAHVGSFEWNIGTGVNRWTPELERLYGLPRGGFPGTYEAWEALVHPEDRPETVRRVKEALDKGWFVGEWRVVWPDGRVRWLTGRARVFKDRSGRPLRMLGVNIDITDRKQTEDSLRQSEARFHALIDASAQIVWTSNAQGEIVEDSPSWRAFTGQTVTQWLEGAWPNAFHPDDRQRMLSLWRKAVADKIPVSTEYRLRHAGGQWRWMARRAVPLADDKGAVQGWVGMDTDITERKQAEEWLRNAKEELEQRVQDRTAQLREALERAQDLYHKAPCGYHSLDRNGLYLQVNDTELRWLGYRRDEVVRKKTVFDLLTPQSRAVKEAALRQLDERGSIADVELTFIRADGSILPVLLSASAVRDEAGRFFMSRSIVIDLTARKRMERALRESEGRLQAILENSPAIMFVKDVQGRYLHINREFARAFHVTWGEVVGKTDAEIFTPAQAAAFAANDRAVIESRTPMQFDEVAMQADGRHNSIVSKFPLLDADGKVYAIGGIVTDVTERRRLEAEVLRVSDREQLRISQDLHDGVGQQLAGIWCLSDALRKLLETQGVPEAAQAAKISTLLKSALNQTRSLARGLHPVSTEPNGLMSALRELAATVAEMFKVTCRFQCPQPVLVHDAAVAANLYRIAQEALTNAVKHGRAQRLDISLTCVSQRIALAVRDDGVGIRKTPRPRKGMGLRIMNYRAGMIGGALTIQKNQDGGTDVVCTVPESAAQEQTANGHANAKTEGSKESFSGR